MSHANENDADHKVWAMMKDISICMLATHSVSGLRSRPVAAYARREENTIYVLTDVKGHKDNEIEANPEVLLNFADKSGNSYVSLNGKAAVSNDRAKIKELWNVWAKAWWDGPEDPNIRLLRIEPKSAEYWDSPGRVVASVMMVFQAVTGKRTDLGENKKVAL